MSGKEITILVTYLSDTVDGDYFQTHSIIVSERMRDTVIKNIEENGMWIKGNVHIPAHCIRSERIV